MKTEFKVVFELTVEEWEVVEYRDGKEVGFFGGYKTLAEAKAKQAEMAAMVAP